MTNRERQRAKRKRVAMVKRLAVIILPVLLLIGMVILICGCEDSVSVADTPESSSTPVITTEPVTSKPTDDVVSTIEPTPTTEGYKYPFNTVSCDWGGDIHTEGFKYYEIPDEYAMSGGYFPEIVQVYLWSLCRERDIDYCMVVALIERESGYKWDTAGDDGSSIGYMQVSEKWHKDRMAAEGVDDLFNPYGNIRVGLNLLQELNNKYLESSGANCVLMVYNMGASGANKLWKENIYSTEYSRGILARAEEIRAELGQK